MKKPTIYYKVLTSDRKSFIMANRNVSVKYPINEWVRPKIKGSRLMAFRNKERATEWAWAMSHNKMSVWYEYMIVECNALHPIEIPFVLKAVTQTIPIKEVSSKIITQFWDVWNRRKKLTNKKINIFLRQYFGDAFHGLPSDSIAATAIKCLE